ncbi:MAG: tetratricopeptide repeat protein, partial [Gemmatimonadota bacterium]|nr:tetratricopeptide repeat protein [Gemmatimonadota bacterium]
RAPAEASGLFPASGAPSASAVPVVAVLPFDNLSDSEENEYFADGMTEELLARLARLSTVRVISRQSVMRYKDTDLGMRQIADSLGATHVVEASVRRAADAVRITAQLIDAREDRHLWADQYDRELTVEAIFDIQSDIGAEIAAALEATLSPGTTDISMDPPTHDLTAYDFYLRGRETVNRGTREDVEQGIALIKLAIERDPNFALAHSRLAFAYTALVGGTGGDPLWMDSAAVAARTALDLDPLSPDALSVLALVQWNDGRMTEAEATYARVLEARPNDAESLWGLAFVRWLAGRLDEAVVRARRAVILDPATAPYHALLGRCYAALGDDESAEAAFREALRRQPDSPWAHEDLIVLYLVRRDYDAAAEQLRILEALRPGSSEYLEMSGILALRQGDYRMATEYFERHLAEHPDRRTQPLTELGVAYERLGDPDRAREAWDRAAALALEPEDEPFWGVWRLGRLAAARGWVDEAVGHLEEAYDRGWRGWPSVDIRNDVLLTPLSGNERFDALRERILEDVARMRANLRSPELREP